MNMQECVNTEATIKLLFELSKGKQSGDAKGWLSIEDLRKYLDEVHDKFLNTFEPKSDAHGVREDTVYEVYSKVLVAEKQIQNGELLDAERTIDNLCRKYE